MKKNILLTISILFGLIVINAGLNKFFKYMPIPEDLPIKLMIVTAKFMQIKWLYHLVAIVEISGGVLFMITRTRALGAIVVFPVTLGILLVHIDSAPYGLPLAIIMFAINIWVIFENRSKYLPMIS